MNEEKVIKLLKSKNVEDCLIGYEILLNADDNDVLSFFKKYTDTDFDPSLNTYGVNLDEIVSKEMGERYDYDENPYNFYIKKGDYYLALTNNEICLDDKSVADICIHRCLTRGFKI